MSRYARKPVLGFLRLEACNFGFKENMKKSTCTIYVAKRKTLISYSADLRLFRVGKILFSHEAAQVTCISYLMQGYASV